MIKSTSKYRITRKPHICERCGKQIPVKTRCWWNKTVVIRDSEVQGNRWEEIYVCPQCMDDAKIDTEMEAGE